MPGPSPLLVVCVLAANGWMLWMVWRLPAALTTRLVIGLPLLVAASLFSLSIWAPPRDVTLHRPSLMKWNQYGTKMSLNLDHPAAKFVVMAWVAIGIAWLLTVVLVVRNAMERGPHPTGG